MILFAALSVVGWDIPVHKSLLDHLEKPKPTAAVVGPPNLPEVHLVAHGDSWPSIAATYNVPLSALLQVNNYLLTNSSGTVNAAKNSTAVLLPAAGRIVALPSAINATASAGSPCAAAMQYCTHTFWPMFLSECLKRKPRDDDDVEDYIDAISIPNTSHGLCQSAVHQALCLQILNAVRRKLTPSGESPDESEIFSKPLKSSFTLDELRLSLLAHHKEDCDHQDLCTIVGQSRFMKESGKAIICGALLGETHCRREDAIFLNPGSECGGSSQGDCSPPPFPPGKAPRPPPPSPPRPPPRPKTTYRSRRRRRRCFAPQEPVLMGDGSVKPISAVKKNDILHGGMRVEDTFQGSGMSEDVYEYYGILITAWHEVLEGAQWTPVYAAHGAMHRPEIKLSTVHNLMTDTRRIPMAVPPDLTKSGSPVFQDMLGPMPHEWPEHGARVESAFHPDVQIRMADGGAKKASLLKLGDTTTGGTVVATMHFNGTSMMTYEYEGALLSSHHHVLDRGVWREVHEANGAKPRPDIKPSVTINFVTSLHRLEVQDSKGIFGDYTVTIDPSSLDMAKFPGMAAGSQVELVNGGTIAVEDLRVGHLTPQGMVGATMHHLRFAPEQTQGPTRMYHYESVHATLGRGARPLIPEADLVNFAPLDPRRCFAPGVKIQLAGGGVKDASVLELGDVTTGGIVTATMRFDAVSEPLYEYGGAVLTGSHYVLEEGAWVAVSLSKRGRPLGTRVERVYNFNTEEHFVQVAAPLESHSTTILHTFSDYALHDITYLPKDLGTQHSLFQAARQTLGSHLFDGDPKGFGQGTRILMSDGGTEKIEALEIGSHTMHGVVTAVYVFPGCTSGRRGAYKYNGVRVCGNNRVLGEGHVWMDVADASGSTALSSLGSPKPPTIFAVACAGHLLEVAGEHGDEMSMFADYEETDLDAAAHALEEAWDTTVLNWLHARNHSQHEHF